jgi:hypothetical protein
MTQMMREPIGASQPCEAGYRSVIRPGSQGRLFLEVLRACASELNWTFEALGAHMGKDESTVRKVMTGDKPMPEGFFDGLPHQVRGLFYAVQAEAHGHYVVSPAETAEDGARALIVGVLSAFAALRLPTRAERMARSEPQTNKQKVG